MPKSISRGSYRSPPSEYYHHSHLINSTTNNMHSIQTLTALLLAAAGTLAQNDDIAGQYYYSTSGCVQNPGPSNTNITLTRGAVNTCPLISAASQPAVTLPRIVSEKTFLVTNSSCQGTWLRNDESQASQRVSR